MANTCTGHDVDADGDQIACGRDAKVGTLCEKHYQQKRRNRLGKTKPIAPAGEGDQVVFRLNTTIKAAAEKYATETKRAPSDLYREAVSEYLRERGYL